MAPGFHISMLWRTVALGFRNVLAHKLRSGLTALGIIFGVASVISMLAIGEGASQEVQAQIRRLGSQNIILRSIKPVQKPDEEASRNMMKEYGLKYTDYERLVTTLPAVKISVPIKSRREDLRVGPRKVTVNMAASVPEFIKNQPVKITRGRFLTSLDMHQKLNVCVLSETAARDLFQFEDPLGSSVQLGADAYRIVGLLSAEDRSVDIGSGSGDLASLTADCFVPITTIRARLGDAIMRRQQGSFSAEKVELSEIIVEVQRLEDVKSTAMLIEQLLDKGDGSKEYEAIVPLRLLEEAKRTQRIFSIVLGLIGAISLLVGGIGIMNIMLATVSERTREIGVRRALGARRFDIMAQFLVETMILSIGGGILGMGVGAAIPWIVTRFSDLPTVLTAGAFILSFAISAAVGIIFGLYPARRAAMMDPIDALRHE